MHFRTRPRLRTIPTAFIAAATLAVFMALLVKPINGWANNFVPRLDLITLILSIAIPLVCIGWYLFTFVEVYRGRLRMQGVGGKHEVDLRELVEAEVFPRGNATMNGEGRTSPSKYELMLRLRDSYGDEVWLPLQSWQDEDLMMALVLRAAVDKRIRITGDPKLVQRFSGLLNTYKSWDRRQAAA